MILVYCCLCAGVIGMRTHLPRRLEYAAGWGMFFIAIAGGAMYLAAYAVTLVVTLRSHIDEQQQEVLQ